MEKKHFLYALSALSLVTLLYYSWMLGNRPFATPDEARYVEIPREMLLTGDFITPRLNGVKYFEKPPLFYWLQAGIMRIFGLAEFAMRFANLLLAVGGVVATFVFARGFYSLRLSLVAAIILATSPLYFGLAHMILLDMATSVFVTLSLFSFYKAFTSSPPPNSPPFGEKVRGSRRRLWFWGFAATCGLGVMTKGIMALAIPGPIIVAWLTLTRQWGNLRPFYLFTSLSVFLGLVVPWHVAVMLKNPEFAHKYFLVEHFLRFTTNYHERYQPLWFFIPVGIIGLFPWITALPRSFKNISEDPLKLYLSLWAGWVFIFFSIGNSKLIPYILPAFPPLAILLAHGWKSMRGFFIALGITVGINILTLIYAPLVQKPSVKSLLTDVPLHPKDRLVSYKVYFQDLPVYTQRLVTVVEAKGELAFGCGVEDTSAWMIEEPKFLQLWQSQERLWVVMKPQEFQDFRDKHPNFFIQIYRQTPFHVLIVNKEVPEKEPS